MLILLLVQDYKFPDSYKGSGFDIWFSDQCDSKLFRAYNFIIISVTRSLIIFKKPRKMTNDFFNTYIFIPRSSGHYQNDNVHWNVRRNMQVLKKSFVISPGFLKMIKLLVILFMIQKKLIWIWWVSNKTCFFQCFYTLKET